MPVSLLIGEGTIRTMSAIETIRNFPRVLVIDDDMVSREVMATVLTMTGYDVHTASGGAESLTLLDSGSFSPDVVLMDTQMPGINGAALIAQLRTRTTATIYAISGSHAPDSVIAGADGFLLKPIGPEALQQVLEQHVFEFPARSPAASTSALQPPVLSPKTLARFRDMMKENAVREIYAAVLGDLERRRTALDTALENGDRSAIQRIGHSIKGGCGMAGALEAARVGELLEAGGNDLEYIRTLLPLLESAARNLQRMLDAEFSPQGNGPAV
jgi:CheY-like chemotaxis protein/HPt (histidine-containing phosphotransfer) domain-containing protein